MRIFNWISGLGFCGLISLSVALQPTLAQGLVLSGDGSVMTGGGAMNYNGAASSGFSTDMAGGDMVVSDLKSRGAMSAGRDVNCTTCQIEGNVAAGRDIRLAHSPQVGSIAAGHDVSLLDSHVLGSISAGHGTALLQTTVQGNVSTGHEADLQASTIEGSLFQGGHSLKLNASTVQQNVYFQGGQTQYSQSGSGSFISAQNGVSSVRVGEHSLSRVNGYTVQGAAQQTTVITPQQAIYVNGHKVSGDGPKTYAQYRAAFPGAPSVEGPGWTEGAASSPVLNGVSNQKHHEFSHQPPVNVLELSNNSLVNGQVVFESGYGKVLLHPGSRIVGQVVNGSVEKLPQ